MLSFKQYLTEVKRSPERATKLLKYIEKRGGIETGQGTKIKSASKGDTKTNDKIYKNEREHAYKDKPSYTKKVKISKIRSTQGGVFPSGVKNKLNREKNKQNASAYKVGDHYYLRDGHHRFFAAKLQGHTHMHLDIFDKKD